jgi:hypothetical protein
VGGDVGVDGGRRVGVKVKVGLGWKVGLAKGIGGAGVSVGTGAGVGRESLTGTEQPPEISNARRARQTRYGRITYYTLRRLGRALQPLLFQRTRKRNPTSRRWRGIASESLSTASLTFTLQIAADYRRGKAFGRSAGGYSRLNLQMLCPYIRPSRSAAAHARINGYKAFANSILPKGAGGILCAGRVAVSAEKSLALVRATLVV